MLRNRSFVVKMVKDGDAPEESTVETIDVDQILTSVVTAGALLIGTYMAADVARQLLVPKPNPQIIVVIAKSTMEES